MQNVSKWTVKDVITTVLLSLALIVIHFVVNMVCMANDFVSMVLSVGFTMLLCAPVYFLMISRVRKRFVSLIYMTFVGIVFLLIHLLLIAYSIYRVSRTLRITRWLNLLKPNATMEGWLTVSCYGCDDPRYEASNQLSLPL